MAVWRLGPVYGAVSHNMSRCASNFLIFGALVLVNFEMRDLVFFKDPWEIIQIFFIKPP